MQASTVRRAAVLPALQVHAAGPRADLGALLRAGMVFAIIAVILAVLWKAGLLPVAHQAW